MNGKPSLEECRQAFSRIVDLLDDEFDQEADDDTHDGTLKQVSDIAAGFYRDLSQPELRADSKEEEARRQAELARSLPVRMHVR